MECPNKQQLFNSMNIIDDVSNRKVLCIQKTKHLEMLGSCEKVNTVVQLVTISSRQLNCTTVFNLLQEQTAKGGECPCIFLDRGLPEKMVQKTMPRIMVSVPLDFGLVQDQSHLKRKISN